MGTCSLSAKVGERPTLKFDFVGLDGRERRNAAILFRTTAPQQVRVDIRRIDEPDACAALSDSEILADIHTRDRLEFPLQRGLFEEELNVVAIDRLQANGDSDTRIAQAMSGILVDFARGRMEENFGTITMPKKY